MRSVPTSRATYLVGVRQRFGLKVTPVCEVEPEVTCAHVKADGVRCAACLDATGHHAAACGAGGGFVRRHNAIVWELARALRRLGYSVRTEVWVADLAEHHQGRLREARMDLVVQTPSGLYYLDVMCFHPFARTGARRLPSAGGSLEAQELAKSQRYAVRDPATGARRTRAVFVPVVVSTCVFVHVL